MEHLISRTKTLPPRHRADLYSRPRLLDTLSDLLDFNLILLVAPAGYGKTYALMDMCTSLELPCSWYSVSSVDNDISRFVAHLLSALRNTFPDFGEESQTALRNFNPARDEIEQVVVPIVNELYLRAGEHFAIIIDDYHLVDDNEDIGWFISQFVQHANENCHVVLSSRRTLSVPDLPLLVARGQVSGLDFEDLAFRPSEIQDLVLQNYNISMPEDQATDLVRDTEGWITGMMLSAQTKEWRAAARLRNARGSAIGLYDYLAQQVLDQQDTDLREFLLRTSVMEEFDAELCEEVLLAEWLPRGRKWSDLIGELEQSNLFVVNVGDTGTALRYHHLFREFLEDSFERERPEEAHQVLRRLMVEYEHRGDWEMAYETASDLQDSDEISRIIERSGLPMVRAGRFQQVLRWLRELPSDLLHTRPNLLLIRGYSLVQTGEMTEALALLNEAIRYFEQGDNLSMSLARARAYRSIVERLLGDYGDALDDAGKAIELLPANDDGPLEAVVSEIAMTPADRIQQAEGAPPLPESEVAEIRALALHNQGVTLQLIGQPQEGVELLRTALTEYERLGDLQNVAMTLYEIAVAYQNSGRENEALPLFARVRDVWQETHNLMGQALVLTAMGVHYHMSGEYLTAVDTLDDALDCAQRSGYTRVEAFALASLGDVYSDLEMWQTAQEAYRQAYVLSKRIDERFLILYLELARAAVASATQDWGIAYDCLDAAGHIVLDKKSDYEWGLYRLAMGRYYLAQSKTVAALDLFAEAGSYFEEGGQETDAARCALYLAAAAQGSSDKAEAAEQLHKALSAIYSLELRHPLIVAARGVQDFLRRADAIDNSRGYLKRVLEEIADLEERLPALRRSLRRRSAGLLPVVQMDLPTISVFAFGRTEVAVDGSPVPISTWKTKVSRDLFFLFLAFPNGLTKEQIGTLFWPDCSEQQLRTRFKNAIYRLRAAVGQNAVRFEDSVYLLETTLDYEYDVEQFLAYIQEAKETADPIAKAERLDAATRLYAGDYLPDVDAEWARIERERFRALFREAALMLAQLHFEQGRVDEALAICRQLLSDDPCMEEAHRLAMRIHASTGNRAAVVRQYAQCQRALQEEVDAPPSVQTEQLYSTLIR